MSGDLLEMFPSEPVEAVRVIVTSPKQATDFDGVVEADKMNRGDAWERLGELDDDLRRLLGIEQWNLMAVSYGTYMSAEAARIDPDGIRAMILDSIVSAMSTYAHNNAVSAGHCAVVLGPEHAKAIAAYRTRRKETAGWSWPAVT